MAQNGRRTVLQRVSGYLGSNRRRALSARGPGSSHAQLQEQYGVSVVTTLQAIKTLKQWGRGGNHPWKGEFSASAHDREASDCSN